jgi:hypothetical protein
MQWPLAAMRRDASFAKLKNFTDNSGKFAAYWAPKGALMPKLVSRLVSRRQALHTLTGAIGVAWLPRHAFAAAATLDVKDPAAVNVGYVEDASKVDTKKYSTYTTGSNCANCLLLQGAPGAAYRPCEFFHGKLVAAAGWCAAWTAEM